MKKLYKYLFMVVSAVALLPLVAMTNRPTHTM